MEVVIIWVAVLLGLMFIIAMVYGMYDESKECENKKRSKMVDVKWKPIGGIYDNNDNLLYTIKMNDSYKIKTVRSK